MKQKGYVFRNAIRGEPKFRYVMVAAPDGVLVELFQSKEPRRWQLLPEAFPDATSYRSIGAIHLKLPLVVRAPMVKP